MKRICLPLLLPVLFPCLGLAKHPQAAPGVTSLTNAKVKYTVPGVHHVKLQRGPITAIITDNAAVEVPELPGHREGFNGVASLRHADAPNLFVPTYAGLNLEDIHDGTMMVEQDIFEPRHAPMQLRVIDAFTVELYQAPTPIWKLESCGRYHLLPDGVIEYTFECIPRAATFAQGYISVFWASYIERAEDNAIHFRGREADKAGPGNWVKAVSPWHGIDSTHPPAGPLPELKFAPNFPLLLSKTRSRYVHTEPWYYGVSHGLAYVQMFRARDRLWFAQSPSGGGAINPAWDFQCFITDWKVGEAYGFVMRAACLPYQSQAQVEEQTRAHREALNPPRQTRH